MSLRNTAWRRPGLRFVRAGVVYGLSILVSPVALSPIVSAIAASPLQTTPGQDADSKPTSKTKNDKHTPPPPVVRWDEAQPGCTFSAGDDGKYRYGLWSGDAGVTLAVDARELQVIPHRGWPVLGVFLTIRYRGAASLDTAIDGITLQFMKHYKIVQTSLDPDDYTQKIQSDADALDDETRREVKNHPEKKEVYEARLQEYQKSANEMIEFLGTKGLGLLQHEIEVVRQLENTGRLHPPFPAGRQDIRIPLQTTAQKRRTPAAEKTMKRASGFGVRPYGKKDQKQEKKRQSEIADS